MPLLPDIVDIIWLIFMFISFGAITAFAVIRDRFGLFMAVFFAISALGSGFYWWVQNYQLYQRHSNFFGEFYKGVSPWVVWVIEKPNQPPETMSLHSAPPGRSSAPASDDQVKIVEQFYNALGRADGQTAANLIIPEKRISGPFAPSSIYRFYSTLLQPLRLESVVPLSDDRVEASYDYIGPSGKVCRDIATASLTMREGSWLIATIVPKGRC